MARTSAVSGRPGIDFSAWAERTAEGTNHSRRYPIALAPLKRQLGAIYCGVAHHDQLAARVQENGPELESRAVFTATIYRFLPLNESELLVFD